MNRRAQRRGSLTDTDRKAELAQLSALGDLTPAVGMLRSTRPVLISGRGWGGSGAHTLGDEVGDAAIHPGDLCGVTEITQAGCERGCGALLRDAFKMLSAFWHVPAAARGMKRMSIDRY